jgi:hypothetical protein
VKFFKSSLSLGKPQRFGIGLELIVDSRNQTLGELNAISQWEFHRIGRELI